MVSLEQLFLVFNKKLFFRPVTSISATKNINQIKKLIKTVFEIDIYIIVARV